MVGKEGGEVRRQGNRQEREGGGRGGRRGEEKTHKGQKNVS